MSFLRSKSRVERTGREPRCQRKDRCCGPPFTTTFGIAAHVLRCSVASLDSRQSVQYCGALKFDQRCEALWEASTHDGYLVPVEEPSVTARDGLPGSTGEPDAASGPEPE